MKRIFGYVKKFPKGQFYVKKFPKGQFLINPNLLFQSNKRWTTLTGLNSILTHQKHYHMICLFQKVFIYIDANHAHDVVTCRLMTRILLLVNNTLQKVVFLFVLYIFCLQFQLNIYINCVAIVQNQILVSFFNDSVSNAASHTSHLAL
jgi:hypothetical protein